MHSVLNAELKCVIIVCIEKCGRKMSILWQNACCEAKMIVENILIGSDELILWIRKNFNNIKITNDKIGKKIHDIIVVDFKGIQIEEDKQCIWSTSDKETVNENRLPKTAAQYSISLLRINEVYERIFAFCTEISKT